MNKKSILILFLVVLLFPSLVILGAKAAKSSVVKSAVRENAEVYTCPMHPEIVSDKPGDCPICGMDLVLKQDVQSDSKTNTGKGCCGENMMGSGCDHQMDNMSKEGSDSTKTHDHNSMHKGCMGH